jgi:uncharacterized protein
VTVSAIYHGHVVHTRLRPVRHRLKHRLMWLLLDLDELPALSRRLWLFSLNRFNLVDFRDRDHGDSSPVPMRAQIDHHLSRAGLEPNGGAVRLLCMPRVLGTVFNPLSVWFCHRTDGSLQAMIYEVTNTFGERHSYLIPVGESDTDAKVLRQSCLKQLHVSPFLDTAMTYYFRVVPPTERTVVAIEAHDAAGPMLSAAFVGRRHELTDLNLLRALVTRPLLAVHVLGAIHWEAFRLWRKGARFHSRPMPPSETMSYHPAPVRSS